MVYEKGFTEDHWERNKILDAALQGKAVELAAIDRASERQQLAKTPVARLTASVSLAIHERRLGTHQDRIDFLTGLIPEQRQGS